MTDQYDVFISHVSEDKDSFVRPLAQELQKRNYRVWYDEFSLKLGDSLRSSIDKGLSNSKYGIVVLSHNFFKKVWTEKELNGLNAKEITGVKSILPLWHNVSYKDIVHYSPTLADKVGVKTSEGLSSVVSKIVEVIDPSQSNSNHVDDDSKHSVIDDYNSTQNAATFSAVVDALVDTNTIRLDYISLNFWNPTNLIMGLVNLKLQINQNTPIIKRVHIGKHKLLSQFTCMKYGRTRIAEITVDIKLSEVNYFLKVDGKEYKLLRDC
ncbi:MAG: TIR domain-containing protein [Gloeotrichia echinulata GP01]